jgi:hypothetical protein
VEFQRTVRQVRDLIGCISTSRWFLVSPNKFDSERQDNVLKYIG